MRTLDITRFDAVGDTPALHRPALMIMPAHEPAATVQAALYCRKVSRIARKHATRQRRVPRL